MHNRIFLFGEAEKGEFRTPLLCKSLAQLVETLGNPPEESQGIFYAISTLLNQNELIFFRVREEGFSKEDYLCGFTLLQNKKQIASISAICMPGVGDLDIINAAFAICQVRNSLLIINEKDLYDYLTNVRDC